VLSYNVEFTLRDRVLNRILARGVCPVTMPTSTRLSFESPVALATVGGVTRFSLRMANGPDNPLFTFDFGDGSPKLASGAHEVSHVFDTAAIRWVSATVENADQPTQGVLAQATCRVDVEEPLTAQPCPCSCGEGIESAVSHTFEEWEGRLLHQYGEDAYGRAQGLHKVYNVLGEGEINRKLDQCYCEVNGKQEGWWLWFRVDGSLAGEEHYVAGQRDGPWRGWARSGALLWESFWVNGWKEGPEVILDEDGTVIVEMTWPSIHVEGAYTDYWPGGDGSTRKEESQFAGGRRDGPYKRWYERYDATVLEQEGEFRAGEKVGVWKYYNPEGVIHTVDYGEP
jgi:antitoxin component YwqK of YwqJK toxin-antitoxin module